MSDDASVWLLTCCYRHLLVVIRRLCYINNLFTSGPLDLHFCFCCCQRHWSQGRGYRTTTYLRYLLTM